MQATSLGVVIALTQGKQTIDTRSGRLDFEHGVPTTEAVTKPYDEMDHQRTCQAYLWAFPVVKISEWQRTHKQEFRAGDFKLFPDTPRLASRAPLS